MLGNLQMAAAHPLGKGGCCQREQDVSGVVPFPPIPLGVWEFCPRVDFCFPTPNMAGLGTTVSAASVEAGLSPGGGDLQDQSPSLRGPEIETPSQEGCRNRKKAVLLQEKNILREILEEIPQGRNPLSVF